MSGKKSIELKFGDDAEELRTNPPRIEVAPKTNKHNFNGFIIEVTRTKDNKPASVELKYPDSDENTAPNTNGSGDNKTIPSIPDKPPHLRSAPAKPKTETSATPVVIAKLAQQAVIFNELEGAVGMWARGDQQVDCFEETHLPGVDTHVEPPPLTDANFEIFNQFTVPQLAPDDQCYGKLLLLEKQKLITNHEDFVCSICENFILKQLGIVLKGCLHNFCSPCLIKHIISSHDDFGMVICPFPLNPCDSMMEDAEIQELLGDEYPEFAIKIGQLIDANIRERERVEEAGADEILPYLIQADEQDYFENYNVFECQVCLAEIEIGDGIILKTCLHQFCKLCLIGTVEHTEDVEVKCPNNDPVDGICREFLTEREIRGLVPDEVFDKHLDKSLKLYEGTFAQVLTHCKTPDCRGFVEPDGNLQGFTCPVCLVVNCIGCKAIHAGKNCQQFQDEVNPDGMRQRENVQSENAIHDMISNNTAMWCPRCGIPVMKDEGCDFITCTACKLGICWRLKKPRLAVILANGTLVDGCHCLENGVRCHPQCRNCH